MNVKQLIELYESEIALCKSELYKANSTRKDATLSARIDESGLTGVVCMCMEQYRNQ